jgi:hypothetical protein
MDFLESRETIPDLVPPRRWALVEEGLGRGGYPLMRNFNFLRRLKLKTIISLVPDDIIPDLMEFCEKECIRSHHIRTDKFKGEPTLLPNDCASAMELLLNVNNYPIFVHCLDGRHVTGHLLMLLRKIALWNNLSIAAEHQRFTRETLAKEEMTFVEDYVGPVTLPSPSVLPPWIAPVFLDADGRLRKHPSIKIKFSQVPKMDVLLSTRASVNDLTLSSVAREISSVLDQTVSSTGPAPQAVADGDAQSPQYIPLENVHHLPLDSTGEYLTVGSELYALNAPSRLADVKCRLRKLHPSSNTAAGNEERSPQRQLPRRYSTNSLRGKPRDQTVPR